MKYILSAIILSVAKVSAFSIPGMGDFDIHNLPKLPEVPLDLSNFKDSLPQGIDPSSHMPAVPEDFKKMYDLLPLPPSCSDYHDCKECLEYGCSFEGSKCAGGPPKKQDLDMAFLFESNKKCLQYSLPSFCEKVEFFDFNSVKDMVSDGYSKYQTYQNVEKLKSMSPFRRLFGLPQIPDQFKPQANMAVAACGETCNNGMIKQGIGMVGLGRRLSEGQTGDKNADFMTMLGDKFPIIQWTPNKDAEGNPTETLVLHTKYIVKDSDGKDVERDLYLSDNDLNQQDDTKIFAPHPNHQFVEWQWFNLVERSISKVNLEVKMVTLPELVSVFNQLGYTSTPTAASETPSAPAQVESPIGHMFKITAFLVFIAFACFMKLQCFRFVQSSIKNYRESEETPKSYREAGNGVFGHYNIDSEMQNMKKKPQSSQLK